MSKLEKHFEEIKKKIVDENKSYESVGKEYKCSGANIKKFLVKNGVILPIRRSISAKEHFNRGKNKIFFCLNCNKECKKGKNSKGKFCSPKCQQEYYQKEYIERWKNGLENGIIGEYGLSKRIRNYLLNKCNCQCEICGWGDINIYTGTVPLEIHHKDGDYTNNKEENLQVLCPNHHSLTETIKSHNKSGRIGRAKYYKK